MAVVLVGCTGSHPTHRYLRLAVQEEEATMVVAAASSNLLHRWLVKHPCRLRGTKCTLRFQPPLRQPQGSRSSHSSRPRG